jgi:insertion element IS1 protein InsB
MASLQCSCYKHVGSQLICQICDKPMIKNGKLVTGKQRFYCKSCRKSKLSAYSYKAYEPHINTNIISLTKENVGILGTSRLLGISPTTVLSRIKKIAKAIIQKPIIIGKTYEVDELRTFYKSKKHLIWIVYALDKVTKQVVSFNIGARTNKTLATVTKSLTLAKAKTIYTDKLINYKYLIDSKIHNFKNRATNHIERHNLTMRTQLKRLNRRSISFSKSAIILYAVLKIYFWG